MWRCKNGYNFTRQNTFESINPCKRNDFFFFKIKRKKTHIHFYIIWLSQNKYNLISCWVHFLLVRKSKPVKCWLSGHILVWKMYKESTYTVHLSSTNTNESDMYTCYDQNICLVMDQQQLPLSVTSCIVRYELLESLFHIQETSD